MAADRIRSATDPQEVRLTQTHTESSSEVQLRQLVARYARPIHGRAWWQLVNTLIPYFLGWALMAWNVRAGGSYLLTLGLGVVTAGLYVRLFIIQHDCGHGSFFANRKLDHVVGAFLGVLTLFPYGYWKKTHAIHHATAGNLDRREFGDVVTLTVREYEALPWHRRFGYRLYRSAPVLLFIGPSYQFILKHRFPFDIPFAWKKEWASVLWNNLFLGLAGWGLVSWLGWRTLLLVELPILVIAGAVGVWLFYVQHQFEEVYWDRQENWDPDKAALEGSSFYDLPKLLHWFTGNIGYHHIHHLAAKIPNYRLRECFESSALLQQAPRLTFIESLRCARLKLFDEERRRLIPFSALRAT
ncbi:MAG: fatty acid desaturase [Thermoanaerobaculia bacterium]|nr:MAG: fatty acid desaturase [Thermoanaerobaculia bacterium]